ncbi:isoleucine--tRNA ligase, partial [candidate division WWE3 bacterium]|nr:isoleucine--tRNA ligase [candidate division WWE3 bacterium]
MRKTDSRQLVKASVWPSKEGFFVLKGIMYKELDALPDFPKLERQVLEFWSKENIQSRLVNLRKGSKTKVLYDGPITANNLPHYGHCVTWTLKDVIPRFWSMMGFNVERNIGWDCQGIPVEYEVEKSLGFSRKDDIEKYGVAKFNEMCRQSVLKYVNVMIEYETRLGRWLDLSKQYSTMDPKFIESMWWSLKELYRQGLLYQGYKVVAYSTRAGTSLSTHEVNEGGYKEIEDPAVTVKFKLKGGENTYVLAWTTTPWTLPGNLLLAVGKKIDYVKVKVGNEFYILSGAVLDRVFLKGEKYEIVKAVKSEELVGLEYEPTFKYFEHKSKEGLFRLVFADHVNTQEGTGIVHLAPYGMEDFELLLKMNVKVFDYLDANAYFNDLVPDYEGLFYKDANEKIISDLKSSGLLFRNENYLHRMPMCWRTDTPLIYKPVKSWFIAVTKIKDELIKQNQTVNWVPEHVKTGKMGVWLEGVHDWALSRSRYWGTPLPVWANSKSGEVKFVGSFQELEELSGMKINDPHKPFVDQVKWEDKKTGGVWERTLDVIDVWYDSGSMPFARYHYPFENKEVFKKNFPADYVSEGDDQARLWFYTLL